MNLPRNASEMLRMEHDALVRLAQAAARFRYTGGTHVVASVALAGRWCPLLDRFAPIAAVLSTCGGGFPVGHVLAERDRFMKALAALTALDPRAPHPVAPRRVGQGSPRRQLPWRRSPSHRARARPCLLRSRARWRPCRCSVIRLRQDLALRDLMTLLSLTERSA